MNVGIINYGVGNLGSVYRALENLYVDPLLITNPVDVENCDSLILPGVGNFKECKNILDSKGWTTQIKETVLVKKKPILGICLGMQLLADYGYEGILDNNSPTPGLGLISGEVVKMKSFGCKERVPHMGWNSIKITQKSKIVDDIIDDTDFYFVHSYFFSVKNESDIHAFTDYSIIFPAIVGKDNIWGTQFHPEKSSKAGFKVLNNFIKLSKC